MYAQDLNEMNNGELLSFWGEVCETFPSYGEEALGLLRREAAAEIVRRELDDSSLFWDRLYS